MRRAGRQTRSYSVEVHEHTNVRTLPEPLYGVITLDEYLHVVQYAMAETERVRLKGTRFLKFASLCPCVLLFLMPLLVQYLSHIEQGLLQRIQAHCDRASADQNGRVAFRIRHVGGVRESQGKKHTQTQRLWIDMEFADPAVGHVREDLYELQPPLAAGESAPPRPHSPPVFGSDSEDDDDQARLLAS